MLKLPSPHYVPEERDQPSTDAREKRYLIRDEKKKQLQKAGTFTEGADQKGAHFLGTRFCAVINLICTQEHNLESRNERTGNAKSATLK